MPAVRPGAPGSTTGVRPLLVEPSGGDGMQSLVNRIEALARSSVGLNVEMSGKRRSRVSIGLYAGADVLWPTVVRLLDRGFDPGQLGLASLAKTVETLGRPDALPPSEWRRVEGLLANLDVVEAPGGLKLAASRNVCLPFAPCEKHASASAVISLRSVRVWSELEAPITSGATALAVVAPSTEQQWRGTRILLEGSAYPVQTHDVRIEGGTCAGP